MNALREAAQLPYREDFAFRALMPYGPSVAEVFVRLAGYVDQILKGARPGELPIYLLSRFELLINLPTARAIGLTIPPTLVARASRRGD